MTLTLKEIAELVGGELEGDGAISISGAASLGEATANEISFFYHPRYMNQLRKTQAAAVIVPAEFNAEFGHAKIRAQNPAKAFEQVVRKFAPPPVKFAPGIHPTAVIDSRARIGQRVSIQAYAVIEPGAEIGDDSVIGAGSYVGQDVVLGVNCLIYPHVTIRERSRLGARVILHSGAVIGADGFGFEITAEGQQKIPQLGIVQIDDDVEIGANTTVDRARFGRTWIQEGVKIDNLVQVAHNVVISKHTVIAAQAGIAGSTRVGERVMMGGQVGLTGHIEVGDEVMIGAQSGISKSISSGTWFGSPAVPLKEAKMQVAWIRRLGELFERVKRIESKVGR